MRDSEIKDILYNAEEPVSPGVWSAVEAGLDARKRVVPAWLWGAVAFAAAAAVAVGVFLWRPSGLRLEEYSPASPLAARLEYNLPGDIVMQKASAPVEKSAAPVVVLREKAALEAVPDATINPEIQLQRPSTRLATPPQKSFTAHLEDDTYLLNALAWEEKPLPGRDVSLTAAGNLQAGPRAETSFRRGAAAPAVQQGVYNPDASTDKPGFPFSVGIGVKWNFSPRWAIGTGVSYTNISRSFNADFSDDGFTLTQVPVDNMQHWLGVPLNFYFDIVRSTHWKVHALAGGQMDYLLSNNFIVHGNKPIPWQKKDLSLQWSVGTGVGAEYMITPGIGIFLNPTVRYYFTQANADVNGLPVHPFRFMLEAGLRFSIGSY